MFPSNISHSLFIQGKLFQVAQYKSDTNYYYNDMYKSVVLLPKHPPAILLAFDTTSCF